MWRMNRIARLTVVTTSITFLALAMMGSTSASAATLTRAAAPTSAPTTHKATSRAPLAPSGCNNNNFCDYNSGNGGNLCFQQSTDRQYWPSACADHNEGQYNRNGNAVYMYSVAVYGDCWYLLYSGHYLLYNARDHFQGGPRGCTSETLEHKLVSSRFV
jgi:hypothetical protein